MPSALGSPGLNRLYLKLFFTLGAIRGLGHSLPRHPFAER